MTEVFIVRDGVRYGPFDEAKTRELIAQHQLIATDLVWFAGMQAWQPAGEVLTEWLPKLAPTPPTLPAATVPAVIAPSTAATAATAATAQTASQAPASPGYQLPPQRQTVATPAGQAAADIQAPSWPDMLPNGKPLSQAWIRRFKTVEDVTGPSMSRADSWDFWHKCLLYTGVKGAGLNILAGVFGPIYYLIKGMWRQAIARTLLLIVVNQALLILFGVDPSRDAGLAQGIGFALQFLLYSGAANLHYYRKIVMRDKSWW